MASLMRLGFLALGVMAVLSFGPVMAQEVQTAKGSPEAQTLIQRQLEAFAREDAEGAYAEAAPAIKMMFSDSGAFMTMVREHYAPRLPSSQRRIWPGEDRRRYD